MKYFTKEFYTLLLLSYANMSVKKSKSAEQINENFYNRVYEKTYAVFESVSRSLDWYRDTTNDIDKLDKYLFEPNITEEERLRREEIKNLYKRLHKNKKVYPFDEKLCKAQFEERNRKFIELYSMLPQEILSKIADIRVFALGYASAEVKKLLRPFCANLRKTIKEVQNKAYYETDEAESFLNKELGFNEYQDFLLLGIEEKGGDIYLKSVNNKCLIVKNGKIIEGTGKTIHSYDKDVPNCPWSRIIAAELHRTDNKFEAHFLVDNNSEIEETELWYLTVSGADVSEGTYESNDVAV